MADFKKQLQKTVQQAVFDLYQVKVNPLIEHPTQKGHGDYSSNIALVLSRELKKPPQEIGQEIVEEISERKSSILEKCEMLAGFINFWLSPEFLLEESVAIVKAGALYGSTDLGKGKTVVIDYSAPNIAKSFGVGHLRSTVIGQSLYNLYQFLGHKVIGDNHLGDWGTQFGILLYQINSKKLTVNKISVEKLEELYVEFHQKMAEQPQLKEEARRWFKKLEEGDQEARKLWKTVVSLSLAEFEKVYRMIGVKIDQAYGESFYEDKMGAVIEEIRKKELSQKSQGAEIVEFSNLPPALLLKSDGATTYFTRDLATIKYRIKEWDPQKIIYEVGSDQKLHFQQVFAAAKMLGWQEKREFVHVAHGLIRFAEGKMSTRQGKTVKLEEILEEAVKRAKILVNKSTNSKGLSAKQKEEIARKLGIGAIKYFDLSHQPQSDIIFDWEKLFLLEGNSGPYLQYTYARANSVVVKAGKVQPPKKYFGEDSELALLRFLYRFPEIVEEAAQNYSPNLLCNYLFELAQLFNSFYAVSPILKAEGEVKDLRVTLTTATAQVIKNGLSLLGIDSPERI